MGHLNTKEPLLYCLTGKAADIETIVRLRPWMEDVVRDTKGNFSNTRLVTDYLHESEIFEFKIFFYK